MLHFEVELEVAYELSSRLHYLHYIRLFIYLPDFVFFSTWYVTGKGLETRSRAPIETIEKSKNNACFGWRWKCEYFSCH